MNVLFVGMGYMGQERLKVLIKLKSKFKLNIVGYYDPKVKYVKYKNFKYTSIKKLSIKFLKEKKISICVLSTPHNLIKKYSLMCLNSKLPINLFIEKPFGLNLKEAKKIYSSKNKNQKIFVGLNYRYFTGINNLLTDIKAKKFGKINSIQINFGHGHNPNILKSWKLKKKIAGGGVILDPGIHVINLIQLFCKDHLKVEYVKKTKNFWKTGIEEEVVIVLSSKKIPIINISLSVMKWRSTFEILGNGDKGYWILNGRGRSYGPQKYLTGKRWGWLSGKKQRSTEKIVTTSEEKDIFLTEMLCVLKKIKKINIPLSPCSGHEALNTMSLINKIYDF
tara:strand:+ start:3722 stop:4726 length:1005 start_codon:yes stop_codon:yes gene_type:complete